MARLKSKKTKTEADPKDDTTLFSVIKKSVGNESAVVASAVALQDRPRLPMGCFQFDFATGGGVPFWGVTSFYGPEGGGKTTSAGACVASAQRLCYRCFRDMAFCRCDAGPDLKVAFWDETEGDLDFPWLKRLGVDLDRLVVAYPDSGPQALTAANRAIEHPDCGIVIIDSLSNLLTEQDLADNALWTSDMGQQAKLISRFVRIMRMRLTTQRKIGKPTLVIVINQIRTKPGVMYGDPETVSGGHAHRHAYTLVVRFEQFAIKQEIIKPYQLGGETMASRHLFRIKKFKVPIFASSGEFIRARVDLPEAGLKAGEVQSIKTVMKRARSYGVIDGSSGNYSIPGVNGIKTLDDLKQLLLERPEYYRQLQADVITARKGIVSGGTDV